MSSLLNICKLYKILQNLTELFRHQNPETNVLFSVLFNFPVVLALNDFFKLGVRIPIFIVISFLKIFFLLLQLFPRW